MRFVIDESSWWLHGCSEDTIVETVLALLDRLEVTRRRGEKVSKFSELYDVQIDAERRLYQLLWPQQDEDALGRDLRVRLMKHLDSLSVWDDEMEIDACDVTINDEDMFAPSIACAWRRVGERQATACLSLTHV